MAKRRRAISVRIASAGHAAVLPARISYGVTPRYLGGSIAGRTGEPRSRNRGPLPSGRFPVRGTLGASTVSDDEGDPGDFDYHVPAEEQRRRNAEDNNRRLHDQWTASLRDNIFLNTCYKASEEVRHGELKEQLRNEYYSAAERVLGPCEQCASASQLTASWQPVEGAAQVTYVSIMGRVQVSHPTFRCNGGCGSVERVHPIAMRCFPATPSMPRVYYSEALLTLTHNVRLAGPLATDAWCTALEETHIWNGCVGHAESTAAGLPQEVWRNLGTAVRQWWRMESATLDASNFSIQPISGTTLVASESAQGSQSMQVDGDGEQNFEEAQSAGRGLPSNSGTAVSSSEVEWPGRECPACYKNCVAAVADACVGMTQLSAAGRASDFLKPQREHSPFIPDDKVKDLLAERKRLDPAALERPPCADFAAAIATSTETQTRQYIQGVAAVVCRHEFVLAAVNLFTPECFVYYELLLRRLAQLFGPTTGRKLDWFFLDIACQFEPYWEKFCPPELHGSTPRLAVGPWHVKAHVPACQLKYGARCMEGAGNSFGDNVEHVWAFLRKYAHILKRQAAASRQDEITDLLYANQCRKERRLAALLLRWSKRAAERAEDLRCSIETLEKDIDDLQREEVEAAAAHGREATVATATQGQQIPGARASSPVATAAQEAAVQSDLAGPVTPDKFGWPHKYHMLLEQYYALGGDTAVGSAGPQTLAEQARRDQLKALEPKLRAVERRHAISVRWGEHFAEFIEAGGERKRYMIRKLHVDLETRFVDHYSLQRQMDAVSFRERHGLMKLRRKADAIARKVEEDLRELQGWHAAPGEYLGSSYDHDQLSAHGLLAANVLPWQQRSRVEGLLNRKKEAVAEQQERRKRCIEELRIVEREAADMCNFYQYYCSQAISAIEAEEQAQVSPEEIPGGLGSAMHDTYKAGRVYVLKSKLQEYEGMHQAALRLVADLQCGASAYDSDGGSSSQFYDALSEGSDGD